MAENNQTPVRSVPNATVLVSPGAIELSEALRACGFGVITWPELDVQPLEVTPALDQAVDDLYGYDWLIFVNEHAAETFLDGFKAREHDVSELDSLRVCAIGDATVATLENSQVHVDVIATNVAAAEVIGQIVTYAGGNESIQRLNFLIPRAAISRDYLKPELEDAGARADVVPAYQTVAEPAATRLAALQTMLQTSSIDAVVFSTTSDIQDLATLFDASDLGKVLAETVVIVVGNDTAELAQSFNVRGAQTIAPGSRADVAQAIASQLV